MDMTPRMTYLTALPLENLKLNLIRARLEKKELFVHFAEARQTYQVIELDFLFFIQLTTNKNQLHRYSFFFHFFEKCVLRMFRVSNNLMIKSESVE